MKCTEAFILNTWRIWKYYRKIFNIEISVINRVQMPLHRREPYAQKTMSFTSQDVLIKENYMWSRKRIAAFTHLTTENTVFR